MSLSTTRRRLALLAGAAVLAALVVAVIVIVSGGGSDSGGPPGKGEQAAGASETGRLFAGIPQRGTTLGDPAAPATLVEFADLQCPFCRDYALNVLPTVVERYVRSGKLSLELREIPLLGPDSLEAASWAIAAARQDRLYQFADVFYRNQGRENSGYVTDAFLGKVGAAAGLNVADARRFAASAAVRTRLIRTTREAKAAGVTGTPTFFAGRRGGSLTHLPVASQTPDSFTGPLDRLTSGG